MGQLEMVLAKNMFMFFILSVFWASSVAVDVQGSTNTKLFTGNQALDSGTVGVGLGIGASVLGSALLGGQGGCGRKRREAQGTDQRFFLGGGNNCGNSYPSNNYNNGNNYNNYPSNNGNYKNGNNYNDYPSNNYPSNNYNNGNHHNTGNSYGCSCTSLSFSDHYGNVNGNCRSSDHGKGSWCYTTGWSSGCTDLHSSSKYPNNPWSYQACR